MADKITLSEALNVIGLMKNHYKAFNRLDEAITFIATAHQGLREVELSKERLSSSIGGLEDEVGSLEKKIANKRKLLGELQSKHDAEINVFAEATSKQKDRIRKENEQAIMAMEQALSAAQKSHQEVMSAMDSERSTLGNAVSDLRATLDLLKSKAAAVTT